MGGSPAFVEPLTGRARRDKWAKGVQLCAPGEGIYVKLEGRRASRWAAAVAYIAASTVCRRRSRASRAAAISAGVAIGGAGLCCDAHAARPVKQILRILLGSLKQGASNKQ
jgi:hypothetical protein